jgi:hypothetical protein
MRILGVYTGPEKANAFVRYQARSDVLTDEGRVTDAMSITMNLIDR